MRDSKLGLFGESSCKSRSFVRAVVIELIGGSSVAGFIDCRESVASEEKERERSDEAHVPLKPLTFSFPFQVDRSIRLAMMLVSRRSILTVNIVEVSFEFLSSSKVGFFPSSHLAHLTQSHQAASHKL